MFTNNLLTISDSQYNAFDSYQIQKLEIDDLPSIIDSDYQYLNDSEQNTILHTLCYYNINIVSDYVQQFEAQYPGQLPVQKGNIFSETPIQIVISNFINQPKSASWAFKTILDYYQHLNLGKNSINLELEEHLNYEIESLASNQRFLPFTSYLAHNFYYLDYEEKIMVLNGIEQNNFNQKHNHSLINDCVFEITNSYNFSDDFISLVKPKSIIDHAKLFKEYAIDTNKIEKNEKQFVLSFLRNNIEINNSTNQNYKKNWIQQFINEINNINQRINKNCETFLLKAIEEEQDTLIQSLIDNGADVNIYNQQGYNALLMSCNYYPKAINWILPHINDVNDVDKSQNNALFLLADNSDIANYSEQFQFNIVYNLLSKGVDPHQKNNMHLNVFNILDSMEAENIQVTAQAIHDFENNKQLKQQVKTTHNLKKDSSNKLL